MKYTILCNYERRYYDILDKHEVGDVCDEAFRKAGFVGMSVG